ncbi:MAG: cell division protein FtsQ/DivIB [Anaerolineae bacterium]|jgi:cell division septal protein FtsQ|nr:FtsQ-type POTRA domain-containing protein [Chloroflexota bacterium]
MARRRLRKLKRSETQLAATAPVVTALPASPRHPGRVISVLLLLLALALLGVLLVDARFRVRDVQVNGATLVATDEIVSVADLMGKPLVLVNSREVAESVTKAFGCFDKVHVESRLPGTVQIQVVEERALLLWEQGGRYWWLDGDGRVLSEAGAPGSLPVIHDRSGLPVTVGSTIAGVPWPFVRESLAALPAVTDFQYTLEDGLIVFVTTAGWPVYLGSQGNPEYKVQVLKEITSALAAQEAEVVFIDLKNERRPAVKTGTS